MSPALDATATQSKLDALLHDLAGQLGKPYVFGTAGPSTFDCSGLVTWSFSRQGIQLPHHAADQVRYGEPGSINDLHPGDLVFSDWGDGPNSHVGVATGPNQIIVAPHTGGVVQYETLGPNYRKHVTSVRRFPQLTQADRGKVPVSVGSPLGEGEGPRGGGPADGGGHPLGGGGDDSLWSQFDGYLNTVGRAFSGPYKEIAQPLSDIAGAAGEVAKLGDRIIDFMAPSVQLRLWAGAAGVALIALGIYFLSKEVQG